MKPIVVLCCLAFVPRAGLDAQAAEVLRRQVIAAESSFAASMAARDFDAFSRHVATDAVFFARATVQRGRAAVLAGWRPFFEGSEAPFSWRPETVEVLEDGHLAHSSGPVFGADGSRLGSFNSIWRREPDGRWLVVFDKGCPSP